MKRYIHFLFLIISIFSFTVYNVSAKDVCPGVTVTLSWSTSGSVPTSCPTQSSTCPETSFSAFAPYSGSKSVTVNNTGSCTVQFQCENGGAYGNTAQDTLNVVNGPSCCGTGSQVGLTEWNGSTCVAPATPVNGSCNNSFQNGCSSGVPNDGAYADTGTEYRWQCDGQNGGSNSGMCSMIIPPTPINGVCNNSVQNGCSSGSSNDGAYADTGTEYRWRCDGQNGGSNSGMCSMTIPNCANGATNPPTCTICAGGYVMDGGTCVPVCPVSTDTNYNIGVCSGICSNGSASYPGCPLPSGSISASPNPCLMSTGASSCSTALTWNTNNPMGTSAVTKPVSQTVFTGNSGVGQSTTVPAAGETFYLYNNAMLLDQETVTPRCVNGNYWTGTDCATCQNGGCGGTGGGSSNPYGSLTCTNGASNVPICKDPPVVSLTLDGSNDLHLSYYGGVDALIAWDATTGFDPDTCTIPSGNWSNPAAIGSPFNGSGLTGALTSGVTTYSYQCTNVGGTTLASANVTVCPIATPVLHVGNSCEGLPFAGLSFVTGNYTPAATINISCSNSNYYILRINGVAEPTVIIGEGIPTYSTNRVISAEGDYTLECGYNSVDGHNFKDDANTTLKYRSKPPEPVVQLFASPASIWKNSVSVVSWIVMFPNSVQVPPRATPCALSAKPVCLGACTEAQNLASTTVNNILKTGKTDASDPAGASRPIADAINALPVGHGVDDWRATGKKTLQLEKSMDFKLECGGSGSNSSSTVRVMVTSSNEG